MPDYSDAWSRIEDGCIGAGSRHLLRQMRQLDQICCTNRAGAWRVVGVSNKCAASPGTQQEWHPEHVSAAARPARCEVRGGSIGGLPRTVARIDSGFFGHASSCQRLSILATTTSDSNRRPLTREKRVNRQLVGVPRWMDRTCRQEHQEVLQEIGLQDELACGLEAVRGLEWPTCSPKICLGGSGIAVHVHAPGGRVLARYHGLGPSRPVPTSFHGWVTHAAFSRASMVNYIAAVSWRQQQQRRRLCLLCARR